MIYSDKIKKHFSDDPEAFALCGVGAAILGSAVVGAGASIYGANKAADAQTSAANASIAAQMAQYNQMRHDLSAYMDAGNNALGTLQGRLPYLTSAVQPLDAAGLENLPGYQFTREQGLRAAQNSLTATGLGRSGAAVKAAERFGTGLADQTYQTQANYVTNLDLTNRQNEYNRLMALVQGGQNAAAGVGSAGITTGQGVSNSLIGAGNAQAAGYNAIGSAVGGAANQLGSYALFNSLMNNNNGQPVGGTGLYGWQNPDYGGGGVSPSAWYNQ